MSAGPQTTAGWALACTARGWPVFPCQPGGKEPATRHGFHDATTDPDQIRSWWKRLPAANLAVATGHPGPDVLDIDQHGTAGHGFAALDQLNRAGLLEHMHAIVATPSGGLHAYFTGSDQPSGRLPRHHLDFKARGGYVLAPPAQVNGRPYLLLRHQAQSGRLDWAAVTGLLEPERSRPARDDLAGPRDITNLAGWVKRLQQGNRNAGLFWAACRVIEAGQPGAVDDLAAAAAKTGLSHREITRTIASARRGSQRLGQHQPEREGSP